MTIKTVAVTGATGFVGRHIVAQLLASGFTVRALVRDRAKASAVLPGHDAMGLVTGEIGDAGALAALTQQCDACIHLIGIIREAGRQTFQRIHVGATKHILDACNDAGVRRYIHMSALGASPIGRAEYQRTKFSAETLVRNSGLDWTIFRPGLIHGADGDFTQMAAKWCRGQIPPHIFLPYFSRREHTAQGSRTVVPRVSPVAVSDVARVFVGALHRERSIGEIYPLVGGEELDWRDLLTTMRDTLPNVGPKLEAIGLPGEIVALKAHLASLVGLGNFLPFDAGMAIMGQQDATASTTKAAAHLDYSPEGFRQAFGQYAASM
jgi:NADH dehydrogenase